MNEQKTGRTRELIASYRYSVNRFEPQARRVRPAVTARETQRQINNDVANGNVTERRWSRPTTPAVIDKEALDKEMMLLKKANKALSYENDKLKTNNTSLKQQVIQAKEAIQKDPKKRHLLRAESANTRRQFFDLNKDLDKTTREYMALKQDMKYARLAELQAERQVNTAELRQLRELLQQEKEVKEGLLRQMREIKERHMLENRKTQHKMQILEHEIYYLRQNNVSAADRVQKKAKSNLLTRKVEPTNQVAHEMKAKDQEIESLKKKLNQIEQQFNHFRTKLQQKQVQLKQLSAPKPAQKCKKCQELKSHRTQNIKLQKMVKQLSCNTYIDEKITAPTIEQSNSFRTFLTLRLTNLHLSLEEATDYFFGDHCNQNMPLLGLVDIFIAQPLGFMSDRYIQILIFQLCLKDHSRQRQIITVKEKKAFPLADIKRNFRQFLGEFTVPSEEQRQGLFKRIEDLFKYQIKQILEELETSVKQDETISYQDFWLLMKRLKVDEDCVVEMLRIMAGQSIDLNHLNCKWLLDIFMVEDAVSLDSPTKERGCQENRVNPNPEAVRSDNKPNEEEDIIFMNLDPSQLSSTHQDSPI